MTPDARRMLNEGLSTLLQRHLAIDDDDQNQRSKPRNVPSMALSFSRTPHLHPTKQTPQRAVFPLCNDKFSKNVT